MKDTGEWVPLAVALITTGGLLVINLVTVVLGFVRESNGRKAQQRHELKMKADETAAVERARLIDQKHTAFAELLHQLQHAPENKERTIEEGRAVGKTSFKLYNSELAAAMAQAKLLCNAENRQRIDKAMAAFYLSYGENPGVAMPTLIAVMALELGIDAEYVAPLPLSVSEDQTAELAETA